MYIYVVVNVVINAENIVKHYKTLLSDYHQTTGLKERWEEINFFLIFNELLTFFTFSYAIFTILSLQFLKE